MYEQAQLGGLKKTLKKVGKVAKKIAKPLAIGVAAYYTGGAALALLRKKKPNASAADLSEVVVTAQKINQQNTSLTPEQALNLALAASQGASSSASVPVLDEFTVQGKPFNYWPYVAGVGLVLLVLGSRPSHSEMRRARRRVGA